MRIHENEPKIPEYEIHESSIEAVTNTENLVANWPEIHANHATITGQANTEAILIDRLKQSASEIIKNVESSKEDKIAAEKLLTLLDGLKDFGIRFVNIEEYKKIIIDRRLPTGEVFIFKKDHSKTRLNSFLSQDLAFYDEDTTPTFEEYLDQAKELGWASMAYRQTNWAHSLENLEGYDNLLNSLKKAHREAQDESSDLTDIRKRTIDKFIQKTGLKNYALEYAFEHSDEIVRHAQNFFQDHLSPTDFEKLTNVIELNLRSIIPPGGIIPDEIYNYLLKLKETIEPSLHMELLINTKLMFDIKKILEYREKVEKIIGDSPEAIRYRINKAAYAYQPKPKDIMNQEGFDRQYHIAMVFAHSVIDDPTEHDSWSRFTNKGDTASSLLGAVACMPNKELWQEMSKISSEASDWAHPIFDSHGIIRYPRTNANRNITNEVLTPEH